MKKRGNAREKTLEVIRHLGSSQLKFGFALQPAPARPPAGNTNKPGPINPKGKKSARSAEIFENFHLLEQFVLKN